MLPGMVAGGVKSLRGKGEAAAVPKGFIQKPKNSQQDRLSSDRRDTKLSAKKCLNEKLNSVITLKLLLLTHIVTKMVPNVFFKSEHSSFFNLLGSSFTFYLVQRTTLK